MSTAKKPLVLVIMDGWGYSTKQEHNAVAAAKIGRASCRERVFNHV